MKLLVDAGNTALKYAYQANDELIKINHHEIDWCTVEVVLISSVRDSDLLEKLRETAKQHQVPVYTASVTANSGRVICGYKQFQNLGIDRWLAVLAVDKLYPNEAVVVIDSGTATTIDIVDTNHHHLGGWIIPGIDLMMESIVAKAEKVFHNTQPQFDFTIATNTPAAVSEGSLTATLGMVEMAKQKLARPCRIVCTGGYGNLLHQHIATSQLHDDLVFQGLLVWYVNLKL